MKDPYKYFRIEAKELVDGMAKAGLDLEKGEPPRELVAQLLRFAHTLKGAARVVRQPEIADHSHAIEDLLDSHRDSDLALPPECIVAFLERVDAIGVCLNSLAAAPEAPTPEESYLVLRPEIGDIDQLLEDMTEAHAHLASLDRSRAGFVRAGMLLEQLEQGGAAESGAELRLVLKRLEDDLESGVRGVDRELQQARQAAEQLRLINASALFHPLERAARDVAKALRKRITFEGRGGEVRVEAQVLAELREPLTQIVRNAVAHGIESEAQRAARNKAPEGRVQVAVMRRGHHVVFSVEDDGGGVDLAAVQRAAIARGRIPADTGGLETLELTRLLLLGGISTSRTVTEVSGRGIGLDLVHAAVERLGGKVDLRTTPGAGARFEVSVPLSLVAIEALSVGSSGTTVSLPLDGIEKIMRVPVSEIARSAGRETVQVDGERVPFVVLERVLHPGQTIAPRIAWSAVVIRSGSGRAVLAVDRLFGTTTVLLRPLPALAPAAEVVAGASLDAEGNPVLVLDLEVVVREAAMTSMVAVVVVDQPRAPILIIDDSLTTRMLEQSILESAGYRVELATSGEDGLEKAHAKKYALFLVDVEMPGIDGYTFIERTRADPVLRETPSILVTSRGSPSDKKRGEQAGARGYIVKTEFDQGELLERIRRLVG